MKKLTAVLICLLILTGLAACRKTESSDNSYLTQTDGKASASEAERETTEKVTLLAKESFSLASTPSKEILLAYFDGGYPTVKESSQYLINKLGCDSFEIVPNEAYPEDEAEKLQRADNEYENLILPSISGSVEDISKYSVLVIVFPEFNGNMPMTLRTFLEDYDLRRIYILPVILTSDKDNSFSASQLKNLLSLSPVYDAEILDLSITDTLSLDSFIAKEH